MAIFLKMALMILIFQYLWKPYSYTKLHRSYLLKHDRCTCGPYVKCQFTQNWLYQSGGRCHSSVFSDQMVYKARTNFIFKVMWSKSIVYEKVHAISLHWFFSTWNCNILKFMPESSPYFSHRCTWTLISMCNCHFDTRSNTTDWMLI
jgi:hypothetical protein